MRTKDALGATQSTRVEAPKGAGRKMKPHRVEVEKAENGGYTAHVTSKPADGRSIDYMDRPDPVALAFSSFKDLHTALPEMFGEAHPDTTPAHTQEGDEELPE